MTDPSDVLSQVCSEIENGSLVEAAEKLKADYPFVPFTNAGRRYSPLQCMRVFIRDGFIDRYSGKRLIFPAALRALSILLPDEFPFQAHGKTDLCHFAFYDLFPSIDHLVPVSRGGSNHQDNLVCASMLKNMAKANFTIDELGWDLRPPGKIGDWDGLTLWFLRQAKVRTNLRDIPYLRSWADAAQKALAERTSN